MTLFNGTWVNYPMGTSGSVELWSCEEPPPETEYYAVIAGEGFTCAYADNDAYDMYKALMSYPNWDAANVKLLVSNAAGTKHDCTLTKIHTGINWMASKADEDDVCLFFYAGHGTYGPDVYPYDEADGMDEYICPEGGNIRDDELEAWMTGIKAKKIVMLDCCFSGGAIKEAGVNIRTKQMPGVLRAELTDSFARDLNKTGYVVLTASDEHESAYGYGYPIKNGIFTYFMDDGLGGPANADGDEDITAEEMYSYADPRVIRFTGDKQHPQIYDGVTGELPVVKW